MGQRGRQPMIMTMAVTTRRQSVAADEQRPRGFSLVELLVVVGIIGVLLAVLVPTLSQARKRAQAVGCTSSLRQLYVASLLFTHDHGGHLPRPHQASEMSSDPAAVKVCAWLQLRADAAGHADFADDAGVLWKYLEGGQARRQTVVTCPGDAGERPVGWPISDEYPRNFSYSMNWLIASATDAARSPSGTPFLIGIRFQCVQRPAEKIMWYEELAPNDTWNMTQFNLADLPASRHGLDPAGDPRRTLPNRAYTGGGRGNYCFFDGHVESMTPQQILDPRYSELHRPLIPGDPT
jgi:prepilin-type N-terminal cleavage/methylation domain-containing protein/prepilin-type processing-associated H-X9-DG protein